MTTIVRGHHFGPTDTVNPSDLNDLVKNAVVSGLSISDIPGSGLQISSLSGPSGADSAPGWINAQYDSFKAGVGTSIYSEFNYVLTSIHGPVSLFKPTGMESRRFYGPLGTNLPGYTFQPTAGGGGVTLSGASANSGDGWLISYPLGSNHGTTASGARARIVLRGHSDVFASGNPNPGPRKYFMINNNGGSGKWQTTPTAGGTNTNKVFGISMRPDLSGDTIVPGFFFGAPIWRS